MKTTSRDLFDIYEDLDIITSASYWGEPTNLRYDILDIYPRSCMM